MKSTDKFLREYPDIDKKIIDQIPEIENSPELISIDEKIHCFEEHKKEVKKLFDDCRNYPTDGPRQTLPGKNADALLLLDGLAPEDLCGPDDIDRRRNLQRQYVALKTAIEILQAERLQLTLRLVRSACVTLEPLVTDFAKNLFCAYEELEKQLELTKQFYSALERRGIAQDWRHAHWRLTAYDLQLIFGGAGFPTLRWYLNNRKGFWGIKSKK